MRRAILYLALFLAFLFNIERLDFGRANLIDISSIVYILAIIAVASTLIVRQLGRLPLYTLVAGWMGVFFVARLGVTVIQGRPFWGGVYTYLSITEFCLLMIAIVLAHNVTVYLGDFEDAIRNITLADLHQHVQHRVQAQDEIDKEFVRSRRQNYPVSVLVVEPDASSVKVTLNRSVLEIQQTMMTRYVLTSLMRIVSGLTRRTDLIIDQAIDTDSFIVFSPDTDNEQACLLADRVRSNIYHKLGIQVCCGLATFPDEALTFDELIEHASTKIRCEKDLAALEHREPRTAL
jgi:GGDEF domain-containing protein